MEKLHANMGTNLKVVASVINIKQGEIILL